MKRFPISANQSGCPVFIISHWTSWSTLTLMCRRFRTPSNEPAMRFLIRLTGQRHGAKNTPSLPYTKIRSRPSRMQRNWRGCLTTFKSDTATTSWIPFWCSKTFWPLSGNQEVRKESKAVAASHSSERAMPPFAADPTQKHPLKGTAAQAPVL